MKSASSELTKRERQVLVGIESGKRNREIGGDLFISEDTVKTHARRLFRKLGARDRAHAVGLAYRAGLLKVESETDEKSTQPQTTHEVLSGSGLTSRRPSVTLTPNDRDAAVLGSAIWPHHPNPTAWQTRVLEGLHRLVGD